MTYACSDFTDDILELLDVDVPEDDHDSPSAQADLAMAKINALLRCKSVLHRIMAIPAIVEHIAHAKLDAEAQDALADA